MNKTQEQRPCPLLTRENKKQGSISPSPSLVPSVQLSHVRLFATPWTAACQASLSITNSWSLFKLMSIMLVMPSAISSSDVPFSSYLQSFPASGSIPVSRFSTSGGQSIGVSVSASVFPMNIQDWPPLGWTGWISLQSRDSQESSPTPQFKSINSLVLSFPIVQLPYMTTGA